LAEHTRHEEEVVQEFAINLRGEMIRPEDDGYDTARAIFNGMVNKRPAMIVRCAGTSDVIQGVNFARTHNLLLSVRGGGHSIAGKAVCNGGVMLDLSRMKGIRVDPARRIAEAQPGLTLGEFDHETQAFGLATTLGIVSLTGIAGLTLGGGLGWLNEVRPGDELIHRSAWKKNSRKLIYRILHRETVQSLIRRFALILQTESNHNILRVCIKMRWHGYITLPHLAA
jgi:hypothetical protein